MDIQFGLETEYGITRENPDAVDVVADSIALVRSVKAPGVLMRWDYALEDPHRDARGFRVDKLRQDFDEAEYFARDAARNLTFREIKSDYVLKNGARFYNDHAHPEYCTPECASLLDLLRQDLGGDQLVMACARSINATTDNPVVLYKNNTDFQGHSYGCHENYLLPRDLAWGRLAQGMMAFLVTRQIYSGAGKYGWEEEDRFVGPGFQISQRADFFSVLQSVDTMQRRPLINTRDEPHANPDRYRRFHVIIGDANLCPYATYLKVAATCLVLQALINGADPSALPSLADPVAALKSISRDRTWQWEVELQGKKTTTAMAIQRQYLDVVRDTVVGLDPSWITALKRWTDILDVLEQDPLATSDRLDWSAKYRLIESFREVEGLADEDPWLRSLDLAYHRLDAEAGLYYGLLEGGDFRLPFSRERMRENRLVPPADTRAAVRGRCIERFGSLVESAQWDFVRLKSSNGCLELRLDDLFDPVRINEALRQIDRAGRVDDLARLSIARVV